jgi:exopolysaccharide production protein ExoZ
LAGGRYVRESNFRNPISLPYQANCGETMSTRLDGVQILRALAAVAVVSLHYTGQIGLYDHAGQPWLLRSGISLVGASGVDIFFVISGFIMYYTKKESAGGGSTSLSFLKRRAIRILPAYWFWNSLALVILLLHLGYTSHVYNAPSLALTYLLVPSWMDGHWGLLLTPGWTLSYEAYFYLLFALGIALAPHRLLATYTALVIGSLWVLSQFGLISARLGHISGDPLVFEFLYGVLIAHAMSRWSGSIPALARQRLGYLLLALGMAGFISTIFLPSAVGHRALAWGMPAAALVAGAVLTHIPALYQSRLLLLIGDASYSIYLSHHLPMMLLARCLKKGWFASVPPDLLALVAVIATVGIGMAGYFMIERPVITMFSRRRLHAALRPTASLG